MGKYLHAVAKDILDTRWLNPIATIKQYLQRHCDIAENEFSAEQLIYYCMPFLWWLNMFRHSGCIWDTSYLLHCCHSHVWSHTCVLRSIYRVLLCYSMLNETSHLCNHQQWLSKSSDGQSMWSHGVLFPGMSRVSWGVGDESWQMQALGYFWPGKMVNMYWDLIERLLTEGKLGFRLADLVDVGQCLKLVVTLVDQWWRRW